MDWSRGSLGGFGKGGEYDQNMLYNILKELIKLLKMYNLSRNCPKNAYFD